MAKILRYCILCATIQTGCDRPPPIAVMPALPQPPPEPPYQGRINEEWFFSCLTEASSEKQKKHQFSAILIYMRLLEVLDKDRDSERWIDISHQIAAIHEANCFWPEAEAIYREALRLREKWIGSESVEAAVSKKLLGTVLMHMDRLEEAEILMREAFKKFVDWSLIQRSGHADLLTTEAYYGHLFYLKGFDSDRQEMEVNKIKAPLLGLEDTIPGIKTPWNRIQFPPDQIGTPRARAVDQSIDDQDPPGRRRVFRN